MSKFYINEIKRALSDVMQDERVILIGEDVRDPFGGCFKVTSGLSTMYPDRVFNTPISESAITGVATGLSIQGFKPILEIMFYDFMTLCMDQILNHMMKFKQIWNVNPNVMIRTVIGHKDYGVTHSQDLDYIFNQILEVYHPSIDDDVYAVFMDAFDYNGPSLFVEDSSLYKKKLEI